MSGPVRLLIAPCSLSAATSLGSRFALVCRFSSCPLFGFGLGAVAPCRQAFAWLGLGRQL
eukprot:11930034-Alexandrium_andersonii.AAC.1